MRSEKEMMDLIINVAKEDERIRAVFMIGSRANPNVPKDKYQDYDITYFVKDVKPFYNNTKWIEKHFGKPVIMQMPDIMASSSDDNHFTYLMIFEDGNRIDLGIRCAPYIDNFEPAIIILDKDGFLPTLSFPNDKCWHIKPPTEKLFKSCCNEFWWCLNNVGKGIARDELPYTMKMFNNYVRDMLNKMLEWYVGVNTKFSVSIGKFGKYFKKYLPQDLYEMYLKTYSNAIYTQLWISVFTACDLFHTAALYVANYSGYSYNQSEENAMIDYLSSIRSETESKEK